YQGKELKFGPDYLIPTPFDTRLILRIAPAVAKAAAESGVATRPIEDIEAYRESLSRFVYQTSMFMRPVFAAAKANVQRVAYAEGEDERVLRAVQVVVEEGLAKPILIGRPAVIEARIAKAGLRLQLGVDVDICNPEDDPRFRQYWETYHRLMGRDGITPEGAKAAVRRSNTIIAALMVHLGDADAMLCGLVGRFDRHLAHIEEVLSKQAAVEQMATVNAVILEGRTLFIADTYINEDPTAAELAQIAKMAADEVARFGLPAKVAFLSHSNYGSSTRKSALKMREARNLFAAANPGIECDGEMHGDAALDENVRSRSLLETSLTGEANVLICPNLDAANILFNVLKTTAAHGTTIGPILMGAAASAHVLTPSSTVRRVVNMTALAAAQAQTFKA
ncbi:MAG: phosphate acyltransferase, partial [Comamonas sp.]